MIPDYIFCEAFIDRQRRSNWNGTTGQATGPNLHARFGGLGESPENRYYYSETGWGTLYRTMFAIHIKLGFSRYPHLLRNRPSSRPRSTMEDMTTSLNGASGETTSPAIQVSELTKAYVGTLAVKNISFTVDKGTIVGLLGGNGAGKTTTLSMLLGVLVPTAGEITILGANMLNERHRALPRMNFSSPYVGMPARLTVAENLSIYANLYGLKNVKTHVHRMAEDLELTDLLKTPLGDLSAGQKTRASLAKALINDPDILLLDEPTASLDPDTADWVREYFETFQQRTGATILLASHNMGEVERLCHDVLVMKAGVIADQGSPGSLISRYGRDNLEDVFLDIARDRDAALEEVS